MSLHACPVLFEKYARELPYGPSVGSLQSVIAKVSGWGQETYRREIIVTPCFGQYGCPETVFIAINGSPPRGKVLVSGLDYDPPGVFIEKHGKFVKAGERQSFFVLNVLRYWFAKDSKDPFSSLDIRLSICYPPGSRSPA